MSSCVTYQNTWHPVLFSKRECFGLSLKSITVLWPSGWALETSHCALHFQFRKTSPVPDPGVLQEGDCRAGPCPLGCHDLSIFPECFFIHYLRSTLQASRVCDVQDKQRPRHMRALLECSRGSTKNQTRRSLLSDPQDCSLSIQMASTVGPCQL